MIALPLLAMAAEVAPAEPAAASQTITIHLIQGADWAPLAYDTVQGVILFEAQINGQPATLLLDTGTARTVIDTGFARRAGITLGLLSGRATTGTASQQLARADAITLVVPHALRVEGSLPATDLAGMSAALGRPVAGVLGADVIGHVTLLIQPGLNRLSIVASGAYTVSPGAITIPIVGDNQIETTINGQPARLSVDLGFNGVVRLSDAAWRRAIPEGTPVVSGSQTMLDGLPRPTRQATGELRIGGLTARNAPIASGYAGRLDEDGLLGNGFLSRGDLVLDLEHRQLVLIPKRPAAAP